MPELPEVEGYRIVATRMLHREIANVRTNDPCYPQGTTTPQSLVEALVGRQFTAARRIGKLLLLDTSTGRVLGMRFGLSGALFDHEPHPEQDGYGDHKPKPQWNRFVVDFLPDGALYVNDVLRLGSVELDPDEDAMGFDALTLTLGQLRGALANSRVALKTRLMDQRRIAGVGNFIADEVLWRAALDPRRQASSISDAEIKVLHKQLRSTVALLLKRGGSHTGDLIANRHRGGVCPTDGTELERVTIGARMTYFCPMHQA